MRVVRSPHAFFSRFLALAGLGALLFGFLAISPANAQNPDPDATDPPTSATPTTNALPAPSSTAPDNSYKLKAAEGKVESTKQALADTVAKYNAAVAEKNNIDNQIPALQAKINKLRAQLAGRAAFIYRSRDTLGGDGVFDMDNSLLASRHAHLADTVAEQDLVTASVLQASLEKLHALEEQEKAVIVEMNKQQEALNQQLTEAQAELSKLEVTDHLVSSDGKVCPINGLVAFTNDWGQPRSGGRTHKGNDIFAARGTPDVAIVSGRADQNQDDLGGQGIWLYGDDGNNYYYAHLESFAIGASQHVDQGQVIGFVGDTGNARGGATHTHFEIHPGGGEAVNPYPTLSIICSTNRA